MSNHMPSSLHTDLVALLTTNTAVSDFLLDFMIIDTFQKHANKQCSEKNPIFLLYLD